MRPVVSVQNPIRNPLNELLGKEAHIRILRVLAIEVEGPLSASDAARLAGLTLPGAHRALKRLLQSGFVVRVGSSRAHQYELRRSDKLVKAVLTLFQSEKERYEALVDAIKDRFEEQVPYARAAWIQDFPDEFGESLTIGILHETKYLANYIQQLQKHLYRIEQIFDLTIEVNGYTKADLPDLEAGEVTALYGILPFQNSSSRELGTTPLTHEEKDRHMLEISRKLAEAIEHDTSLVRRAKEHVHRLLKTDSGAATKDIEQWRDILESYSHRRLSHFLISTSERANRLRQSNPFYAALSPDERSQLLKAVGGNDDP